MVKNMATQGSRAGNTQFMNGKNKRQICYATLGKREIVDANAKLVSHCMIPAGVKCTLMHLTLEKEGNSYDLLGSDGTPLQNMIAQKTIQCWRGGGASDPRKSGCSMLLHTNWREGNQPADIGSRDTERVLWLRNKTALLLLVWKDFVTFHTLFRCACRVPNDAG